MSKRHLIALIALCGALAAPAKAESVLGINSVAYGGGIYSIDVDTGIATLVESTSSAALGSSANSGNSLARGDNGVLYYTSFGLTSNDTLFASEGGIPVAAGGLVGNVAFGTYGDGAYWYIANNSPFIHQVGFESSGTSIVTDTAFAMSGDVKPYALGDIAFSGSTIYGAGVTDNGQELFGIDLTTFAVTTIASLPVNLQLAFAGSTLIGLNTTTGDIYDVNLSTGALTYRSTVSSAAGGELRINDLASAGSNPSVIPEPAALTSGSLGGLLIAAGAWCRRRRS
ncbi:hypothetical protein [Aquisphaera insulae]|uniref:hypothetical protein n=1 Tax=Aquisphaera insulae TaxID=2712864 RepID=UPI0013EE29D6|nr:hypothetical protein [Aquisphaera insulae]